MNNYGARITFIMQSNNDAHIMNIDFAQLLLFSDVYIQCRSLVMKQQSSLTIIIDIIEILS